MKTIPEEDIHDSFELDKIGFKERIKDASFARGMRDEKKYLKALAESLDKEKETAITKTKEAEFKIKKIEKIKRLERKLKKKVKRNE